MSRAIGSAKYKMCMDIRLYLDTCTSERHRGARVGVRLRRVRARVRPCRVASASGYHRRSERIGVPITRMLVCVRAMRGDFPWLRPVRPHVRPSSRGGRGRTRARCAAGPSTARRFRRSPSRSASASSWWACASRARRRRRRARSRRCRRGAAARGAAVPSAGAEPRCVGCGGGGVAGRRPSAEPRASARLARAADRLASGVGRSRPARPHGGRAGTRPTPSSRRCRRRSTGRASSTCECPRRRAHTAPPSAPTRGGRRAARAPDVHDWVHVCVHMCVRSSACVCLRTYARMRRLRSSVGVGVCVCVCAPSGGRRATATFIWVS